jgi:ribosomal protein L3 glutamine methyltransferase
MPSVAKPVTLEDYVSWAEQELAGADLYYGHGTDNPLDEAAWIVGASLGVPPDRLDAERDRRLTPAEAETLRALVEARIATRKPAAYLLNEAWFAGLEFYVDERVIVPRSIIGEFIAEQFQPWIDAGKVHGALDLCTGSGCIAIALAHYFPDARVDATDISREALEVARINVERHAMQARVTLIESDLFAALAGRKYDLIVTNPPYVDAADLAALPEEYRHEPQLALAAGDDGLSAITQILRDAPDHLHPDGVLIAEVGNSHLALAERYPDAPFTWLTSESGDESVFLITAGELAGCRGMFA